MEISFKNGLHGSYMEILNINPEAKEDFAVKMLLKNQIPGLLPVKWEIINEKGILKIDISSKISLEKYARNHAMKRNNVKNLIYSLIQCVTELDEYMLDLDNLFIRPDMIFTNMQGCDFYFCLNPVKEAHIQEEMRGLFDFLTEFIDYEDGDFVKMVYEMNMIVQGEHYSLKDLKTCLSKYESEELKSRKMFSEDGNIESRKSEDYHNAKTEIKELIDSVGVKDSDSEKEKLSFGRKVRIYLKEKSIKQIIADIDDGVLINEIRRSKERISCPKHIPQNGLKMVGIDKQKGLLIDIKKTPFSVGAYGGKADFGIKARTVSRMHIKIHKSMESEKCWILEDMGTTNGTFVNGRRMKPHSKCEIFKGDEIVLADQHFLLE